MCQSLVDCHVEVRHYLSSYSILTSFRSEYDTNDAFTSERSQRHFDVLTQTKTVMQGLETLKNEHNQVI